MNAFAGKFRRRLFGLSLEETSFARRGFWEKTPAARQRLETIGQTFLCGYHHALESANMAELGVRLQNVDCELQGFAFEGAGMALTLLDYLIPWQRRRLQAFLDGPAQPHLYIVYVGAGWAAARLRRPVEPLLTRLDPTLGWLLVDGYGFHETYFNWQRYVREQAIPPQLTGYARRGFDLGVGRCLWFVHGADVDRVITTIHQFAAIRQPDLWSGVGLACAYAGGVTQAEIEMLAAASGQHRSYLAQGVTFAAATRQRAGNPAAHTELAAQIICGCSMADAARLTDRVHPQLSTTSSEPAFELWRQQIQAQFMSKEIFSV